MQSIFLVCLMVLIGVNAYASAPTVLSSSALVVNDNTQEIILNKNVETKRPIASITKLMTAMIVLDAEQPLDQTLTVTIRNITNRPASSRLPVSQRLTRQQLLLLTLMSSENRAANTLANNYPKGYTTAIRAMNSKAKQLGMKNTYFRDATGLSRFNISTPKDVSILITAAHSYPLIRDLTTHKQEIIKLGTRQELYRNTNPLIRATQPLPFQITTTKTGFIRDAGKCVTMKMISSRGTPVTIVLLNAPTFEARTRDMNNIIEWLESQQI